MTKRREEMSSVIKKENVVLEKWPHWGIDENNRRFDKKKCQYFMYPLSQMFFEKPFLPQAPYLCLLSDPKGNILWSVLSNYTYDPNIICVSHKWLYNFRRLLGCTTFLFKTMHILWLKILVHWNLIRRDGGKCWGDLNTTAETEQCHLVWVVPLPEYSIWSWWGDSVNNPTGKRP